MNDRPLAEKHGRKASRGESDPSGVVIAFGPSVLDALQDLHALAVVHGPEKFDGDAAEILKSMAYGRPHLIGQTLSLLATVCAEAGACYAKTGDDKIHDALREVSKSFDTMVENTPPLTLTKPRGRAT